MEVLFCEPHHHEALPGEDIRGAAMIDENRANVVPHEVFRISTNVCSYDKGIVMWIVLKPKVSFGEGDRDMGPRSAEMLAVADMRDSAEVFFPLTLRLVHWLI